MNAVDWREGKKEAAALRWVAAEATHLRPDYPVWEPGLRSILHRGGIDVAWPMAAIIVKLV